ncbi:MAG: YfcC family protein [Congregibacter sp.]
MSITEKARRSTHPVMILLGILCLASLMTWVVSSGSFERDGRLVVPGSYTQIQKERSLPGVLVAPDVGDESAAPVSLAQTLLAIPAGLERGSSLIFMVLIIGGMFGILDRAGIVDNGINRLLRAVRGNIQLLIVALMLVFSAGSAFLGLASEYLIVIPVMTAMAARIGLPTITGFAIVTLAVKIGYLASVTNPIPLTIAQPLVGVPIFSGAGLRLFFYAVFLVVGIGFMLYEVRHAKAAEISTLQEINVPPVSLREGLMLAVLPFGLAAIVWGSTRMQWAHHELSACYIAVSILLAACSSLAANEAADAFIGGMKKVLLASSLIGVAMAVTIVLEQGRILDTIVDALNGLIGENGAYATAVWMFISQLLLDFMIPSTSGQAAVTMPVLAPLSQLAGVGPQTTVSAFLFGNGITNMLTPTSGTLLAYLAAGRIEWSAWLRYVLPIWGLFILVAFGLLGVAVVVGA